MRMKRGLGHMHLLSGLCALLAILICISPALSVVGLAIAGPRPSLDPASLRILGDAMFGTFVLVLVGGGGAVVLGTLSALLVSLCRFPGRGLFEWLLVLPLAAPVYVLS